MRILTVIGNRPQFIKAAAVTPPLRARHEEVMIHTGQHFDDELSAVFFEELGLPAPDRELGIALGSNTSQTSRMLAGLEPVLNEVAPDVVLVYGDTNSTLAGALAAAQAGVPVAHVEAGMRSFDRSMPEELNRVLTDHLSALLLCPSETAFANLRREGIAARPPPPSTGPNPSAHAALPDRPPPANNRPPGGTVEVVGDVMVDVALVVQPRARERLDLLEAYGVEPGAYVVATAHRAGNVDNPERLRLLAELLLAVPVPVVFAVHPRTRARLAEAGLLAVLQDSVRLVPPLGYVEFAALLCNARAVMTDSGGLQKEAYLAGIPCLTLRSSTEWTETVDTGWNVLVGLNRELALGALAAPPSGPRPPLYGDGRAGERVVQALTARFA